MCMYSVSLPPVTYLKACTTGKVIFVICFTCNTDCPELIGLCIWQYVRHISMIFCMHTFVAGSLDTATQIIWKMSPSCDVFLTIAWTALEKLESAATTYKCACQHYLMMKYCFTFSRNDFPVKHTRPRRSCPGSSKHSLAGTVSMKIRYPSTFIHIFLLLTKRYTRLQQTHHIIQQWSQTTNHNII